jgi:hypothetical protein
MRNHFATIILEVMLDKLARMDLDRVLRLENPPLEK